MPNRKWLFALLPVAAIAITAVLALGLADRVVYGPRVGAGISAELGCAGVYIMRRKPQDIVAQDLAPTDPLLAHVTLTVNGQLQSVTATLLGLVSRTAIYRPGLGCTILNTRDATVLRSQATGLQPMTMVQRSEPWPAGDAVDLGQLPGGVDKTVLDTAVTGAFEETQSAGRIDTRAVIVALHGKIVAERYAFGYDKDTRFLGWSMSKSVTSALIGMLVGDGKLMPGSPPPVDSFRHATDGRQAITLAQLLHMKSGLAFEESYGPGDDSTTMLFGRDDMALYAASQPLLHPPGTIWSYSSGTTNILAHLVFDMAGGGVVQEYEYARDHLFAPAGMTSAEFEIDGTGSFVGSSYLYMTARDWARFGQLYLGDGTINGRRLLSREWVAFSHTSAGGTDEGGGYGAQFWLNSEGGSSASLRWPHLPADTYMALGYNGEVVAIVPSQDLVFVRLGWTTGRARFDIDAHLSRIVSSMHPPR